MPFGTLGLKFYPQAADPGRKASAASSSKSKGLSQICQQKCLALKHALVLIGLAGLPPRSVAFANTFAGLLNGAQGVRMIA
jgi:hypothetical protein